MWIVTLHCHKEGSSPDSDKATTVQASPTTLSSVARNARNLGL